ncbi:MAG: hypothetical protein CL920_34370 [Deltaproteobacteria bacterium]|nr:hypothetical protein [Deltaproteobacteria bacterium]MBU53810.1 hypothetical protein [Deltaproteobacteria bacterium]
MKNCILSCLLWISIWLGFWGCITIIDTSKPLGEKGDLSDSSLAADAGRESSQREKKEKKDHLPDSLLADVGRESSPKDAGVTSSPDKTGTTPTGPSQPPDIAGCFPSLNPPSPLPTGNPSTPCPPACNGGCPKGTCVIIAQQNQAWERPTCPTGMPCIVDCRFDSSCGGGVDCSKSSSCDIRCSGESSCRSKVLCGNGPCRVLCGGTPSCELTATDCGGTCGGGVDCSNSSSCNVQCLGDSSCRNGIKCGKGDCNIKCTGQGSCFQGDIICGTGACRVLCDDSKNCKDAYCSVCDGIDCHNSSSCHVQCLSEGSCRGSLTSTTNGQTGIDAVLCSKTGACDITCAGANSCRHNIVCGDGLCNIRCTGNNSCFQGEIFCGKGDCNILCTRTHSCDPNDPLCDRSCGADGIKCGQAKNCNVCCDEKSPYKCNFRWKPQCNNKGCVCKPFKAAPACNP